MTGKNLLFKQSQFEAIANALGETNEGLTGPEIGRLLATCKMPDPGPNITKRHRLCSAFAQSQNSRQDRKAILAFIRHAMKPERYLREPERFEPMRTNLNRALAFAGLSVDESGKLGKGKQVQTLSEAEQRAQELKEGLSARGVHPDVLEFCRAELLKDNYFHAVLEASKSIADKIRTLSELDDDGTTLVDRTLSSVSGMPPLLAINNFSNKNETSEQRGFANLVRGVFGMFRNPSAHAPSIHWEMKKEDAEDLLSLASLIHRRLDNARKLPRV